MSRPRAYLVVTGSELVRGDRPDLNGPFLARELLSLGVEPARIAIVGDDPDELRAALDEGLRADLCVTSGGLGPTHDDRTVEIVAAATERRLVLDENLRDEVAAVSRTIAERLRRPYAEFADGARKQATLPEGAESLGLAGTAPGLLLAHGGTVVVVLPGPPAELQRLWRSAVEHESFRRLLARTRPPERRVLRFFGTPESAVAGALADGGGDGGGVEATICARDFEIHVDLVVEPNAQARADAITEALARPLERWLFSRDERPVEAIVLDLCRERGLTLATAESCTGGMVAERLTDIPGSSAVFVGGLVAYADDVKRRSLGVPADLLARHGAVSAEVAAAMAHGVREALAADVAVAVTGVAGPGGATPDKPVGLVHLHAVGPGCERGLRLDLPGDRESIRRRSAVSALHLMRRLLARDRHEDV